MYDVIIIGGGIMGLSTGYRLAREGQEVLLLEKSTVGFEASSRNAGGVRQQFRDPRETELARFSVELWQGLSEELAADLEYRQGGGFRLALTDADAPELRKTFEQDRSGGLPVQLLAPREVAEILPIEPREFVLASYCPTDGQANPHLTCAAFGNAAKSAGVDIREHEGAESLCRSESGFLVRTGKGSYKSPKVVVAAGPWTAELLAPLGLHVPLTPRRPEMAETEPVEPLFPSFVSLGDLRGYGRQTAAGAFNIGVRSIDASLDQSESTTERVVKSLAAWSRLFPRLEGLSVKRTWTGLTTWTADHCPILDEIPSENGLFICTGFSGHGFALGPAIGVVMTDLLLGRSPAVDISAFGLNRLKEGGRLQAVPR